MSTQPGIGRELRTFREAAGILTGTEMAKKLNESPSTISRWETGSRGISGADVERFLRVCGVSQAVIAEYKKRVGGESVWFAHALPDQKEQMSRLLAFEAKAKRETFNCPSIFPGPLQIADYTRAIMASEELDEYEIEQRVIIRQGRRRNIERPDNPIHLVAYVHEQALRHKIGGYHVMHSQLLDTRRMMSRPNVKVCIVPLAVPWHPGMESGFLIAEQATSRCVSIDNRVSALFLENGVDVDRYWQDAARIEAVALTPEDSTEVIDTEIKRLEVILNADGTAEAELA